MSNDQLRNRLAAERRRRDITEATCADCEKAPAVVGWGSTGVPVCLSCFVDRMRKVGVLFRQLKDMWVIN